MKRLGLNTPMAQAYLQRFKQEINYILSATTHDIDDPEKRVFIARSIEAAIRMSKSRREYSAKQKGIDVESLELITQGEVDIMKYARLVLTVTDWEVFNKRIKEIFPKIPDNLRMIRWPMLDWKYRFDIPEDVMEMIIKAQEGETPPTFRIQRKKKELVTKHITEEEITFQAQMKRFCDLIKPIVNQLVADVDSLTKSVIEIKEALPTSFEINTLKRELEKLRTDIYNLKNHRHMVVDGEESIVVLVKIE